MKTITQALIRFYKALNHQLVINLIEAGVDLSKFDIIEAKYYKLYIPKDVSKHKKYPMLVVHTDTVHAHIPQKFSVRKGKIKSADKQVGTGADDRNGCYLLHQMMLKRPTDFIFCLFDLEEGGCAGSRSFQEEDGKIEEKVSVFIGLDRQGVNEFALYGFECELLLDVLDQFPNFNLAWGSMTDVAVLSQYTGIACFNLAVGYHRQHTNREYTVINQVKRAEQFLLNLPAIFWQTQFLADYYYGFQHQPYDPLDYEIEMFKQIEEGEDYERANTPILR